VETPNLIRWNDGSVVTRMSQEISCLTVLCSSLMYPCINKNQNRVYHCKHWSPSVKTLSFGTLSYSTVSYGTRVFSLMVSLSSMLARLVECLIFVWMFIFLLFIVSYFSAIVRSVK